jgi:hypothetical protein
MAPACRPPPEEPPLSIYNDLCYSDFALITSVVLCGPSVVKCFI